MLLQKCVYAAAAIVLISISSVADAAVTGRPHRILLDTDVDTDDLFALLYLLKLNPAEFDLQAVTISTNAWTDAGHAVNHVYDILYMMNRDDIAVGVGGEGSILEDGTIQPDVGGYLPIIEQGIGTAGYCRYRQAIPVGSGGRLDIDTNYGFRKSFLPRGRRKYLPLRQPTAQKVMIDKISAGPITIFAIGAHTNLAIFLMNNPHLKKNIEHIYIMGGGRMSGNVFTAYSSNPYAEFNIFGDPFAAYQSYFMWDSFTAGVATSIMRQSPSTGENEFAEMEYMNITVTTSNQPYGTSDGSNPFFDGLEVPKFNLKRDGVHSGHVQTGIRDPFCFVENGRGKCRDGWTAEVAGSEAVRVLVAMSAKPNQDNRSSLNREFFVNFLNVINSPEGSGRFNITTQFPYYKEALLRPDFEGRKLGKNVVFDMDMSVGDFLALFYLLKLPVEVINLKAILVSPTGWANAATIDVIYDFLHMMGRDDIPVGLGEVFSINQSYPSSSTVGNCKYNKAIPNGSGGSLDSDTLYGFARDLPRSPRRYTAENSVKFGAPRDTDNPELRQPLALEIWDSVSKSLDEDLKITILTNGPLTNLARILLSRAKSSSLIEEVFIVGGHINYDNKEKGDLVNVPSNKYAEFNMFLDPLAAKTVFDTKLDITLIPLTTQRKLSSFQEMSQKLYLTNQTREALFARHLLSRLRRLKQTHPTYGHLETFLGEILGAVVLGGDHSVLGCTFKAVPVKVSATGVVSQDGEMTVDEEDGKLVRVLENFNTTAYHAFFANRLGDWTQTAIVGSFDEQRRIWSTPLSRNPRKH